MLCLFCAPALAVTENCPSSRYDESSTIRYVHDGDTIKLVDGRKIRLIGINTPEVAKDGNAAENYALAARDLLRRLISKQHNRIQLVHGLEGKDHYQRLLSHVFLPDGTNLQAQLLASGLATAITIPPNSRFSDCYQKAEQQAICQTRGLWSHQIKTIAELKNNANGFHVLKGKLQKIQPSRKGIWLTLEHGLSLRIAFQHKSLFDMQYLNSLIDQEVIVRGWLQAKKQPRQGERFYMQIKHPSSIEGEKIALKC